MNNDQNITHGFQVTDGDSDKRDILETQELPQVNAAAIEAVSGIVEEEKQKSKAYKNRLKQMAVERQTLAVELAEKDRLLAEREAELTQRDAHYKETTKKLFEQNLSQEQEKIISELKAAKEEGNIDREVELTNALSRVQAEQVGFDVLSATSNEQNTSTDQEEFSFSPNSNSYHYEDPQLDEQELPEAYCNFLARNPWANPNDQQYSPALAQEVEGIAGELNKRLALNGQAQVIGTDVYYNALADFMKNQYASSTKTSTSTPYVSGVNRSGASMADQYMHLHQNSSRYATTLTPEEYRIARNMRGFSSGGGYISEKEAVDRYIKNKQELAKDKNNPWRLTID